MHFFEFAETFYHVCSLCISPKYLKPSLILQKKSVWFVVFYIVKSWGIN